MLNPWFSSQTFAFWAFWFANVGLWHYDEKDNPVLELAAELPAAKNGGVSADGKTITIKLKKDLRWSDGEPLTSAHLKFTCEQVMNDANKGITGRDGYDKIESIETPDKETAAIKFTQVYAPWALLFAYKGLMPQHALKDLKTLDGSDWALNSKIGHGPFKITELVKGDRIVFEANPLYWRGKPKLDRIFVKIVPDRDALLAGLRAGDVDTGADFAESNIPDLEGLSDQLTTCIKPGPSFEHYFFNIWREVTQHAAAGCARETLPLHRLEGTPGFPVWHRPLYDCGQVVVWQKQSCGWLVAKLAIRRR